MEQMTKQVETRNTKHEGLTARRIVGIIFGVVEIILALRLIFKLLGANPENSFIKSLYDFTHIFVVGFESIFSKATTTGIETTSVFEPGTLITMVVIALIAWLVLKLMTPHKSTIVEKTERAEQDNKEE